MATEFHVKKLLLEFLLLGLDSIEVFKDLLSLSIITNVEDKINLLLPQILIAISLALNINQSLDEFIFLHFSLNNLDISLGLDYLDW